MGVLSKPQASPTVHTLLAGWGVSDLEQVRWCVKSILLEPGSKGRTQILVWSLHGAGMV